MANVSLFIGGIRLLPESGRPTGMYKQPATGPLELGPEGFVGDQQADRRVHGGPDKAVHLYPARHYARLAARFPEAAALLVAGSNGENLSTPDLDENDIHLGDIWQLGTARLQLSQPRSPCWKIDERYACDGMAQAMLLLQEHRPALAELEKLAASPGVADNWRRKMVQRIEWLRKNGDQTPPPVVTFHVKPDDA